MILNYPRKNPRLTTLTAIAICLLKIISPTAKATEVSLETPLGGVIKGLLVKKSTKEIEVQTEHGIVQIKEKDLTPTSWSKAQVSILSRPRKIKNEGFIPEPRKPKEIKVSAQKEEDKPIAVPYTGFTKDADNPTSESHTPQTQQKEEPSVLYINTQESIPWKLEGQSPQIPNYEDIDKSATTTIIELPKTEILHSEVISGSKKDAIKIFFPLTIVALSLVLLAKSNLPIRTKIASYVIIGFLLLSIYLENTLFGVLAIACLCTLMLVVEILSARKRAIEEALNLAKPQAAEINPEEKKPNKKKLTVSPFALSLLEWKKFEEFCCLWLNQYGFEVSRTKAVSTIASNRIIEGRCQPKTRLSTDPDHKPKGKKFKALCRNWETPVGIRELKEIKKACTSTEVPIVISILPFSEDVVEWAKTDHIRLISNKELTKKFNALSKETKIKIIEEIWDGKQDTPTCPVCNQKMTSKKEHTDQRGNYKTNIWYCNNFQSCHQRIVAKSPKSVKEDKVYPDFSSIEEQ